MLGLKLGKDKLKRLGPIRTLQSKSKAMGSMKRMRRNLPFLKSALNEGNPYRRQELLQHANSDQTNTMSEMVMNVLKNNISIPPPRWRD